MPSDPGHQGHRTWSTGLGSAGHTGRPPGEEPEASDPPPHLAKLPANSQGQLTSPMNRHLGRYTPTVVSAGHSTRADSQTVPGGLWGGGTLVPILQRRLGEGTDGTEQSWLCWESHCFGLATLPGWPHTWAGPWPAASQWPQGVAGHKLQKAQTTQPGGAPGDGLLVSRGR